MEVMLRVSRLGTATVDVYQCVSFSLVRDRYVPYSTLRAVVIPTVGWYNHPCKAQFYLDGVLMHEGIIEQFESKLDGGQVYMTVVSKGYSAALMHNQPVPGIYSAATLQSLMEMYQLPFVTYQDDVVESRYMYVKDNTSMWDMLCHYNFKLNGGLPYITVPNHVCVLPKEAPPQFTVPLAQVVRTGDCANLSKMISRVDMADASGNYGAYSLENESAESYHVMRVKQITLDKQYLSDPEQALLYRIDCSMRKMRSSFAEYVGYCGEDIGDQVTVEGFTSGFASRIEVSGSGKQLRTVVHFYHDPFCNQ